MAHFARLDENNVVIAVHVVHNNELAADNEVMIENGFIKEKLVLSEERGIQFLKGLYGADTRWVQTSYNNKFRGRYAGIGFKFENNEFIAPPGGAVPTPVLDAVVQAQLATSSSQVQALTTSDISSLR